MKALRTVNACSHDYKTLSYWPERALNHNVSQNVTDLSSARPRTTLTALIAIITALLSILCLSQNAQSNMLDLDALSTQMHPVSLADFADYWRDASGESTIDTAIAQQREDYQSFSQIAPYTLHHGQGILWLKLKLPPLTLELAERWQIVFNDHRLEKLLAVQLNRNGMIATTRLGRIQRDRQPSASAAGMIIKLSPSQESSLLYIGLESDIPVQIAPTITQSTTLYMNEASRWFGAAFFPAATFMAWLCYIGLSGIRHRNIPAMLWTLGPILASYCWINTPLSHGYRVLGSGWTWHTALTTAPLIVGLAFLSVVKQSIEKSRKTHHTDQILAYAPLLFLLAILANLALSSANSLIMGWMLLSVLILWSCVLLKKRHKHSGQAKLLIFALVSWLPLSLLEISFALGLSWCKWPREILLGPVALLSEVMLFVKIERFSIHETDRQLRRLRQQKKGLSQTLKNLEVSLEIKNRFFQKISRDIAHQLSAISSLDKHAELPEYCHRGLQQLSSLSRDIRRFCEIEAGCLRLTHRPFNFKSLIQNLSQAYLRLAKHKGLDFKIKLSADIPDTLNGDPEIIAQLLGQLLDNAIRYTNDGHIEIKFDVVSPESTHQPGEDMVVMITITDTGPGLPDHLQKQFYGIIDNEQPAAAEQLGVGLTTCRHMVELMQGEIHITSLPNKGTSCYLTLPLKADSHRNSQGAHKRKAAPQPIKASSILGKAGVQLALLITEDVTFAKTMISWLKRAGYKSLAAADTTAAVDLAAKNAVDIIIATASKAQPTNFKAIAAIRQMAAYKKTPIIGVIRAQATDEERQACQTAGATDILEQPFSEAQFSARLQPDNGTPA